MTFTPSIDGLAHRAGRHTLRVVRSASRRRADLVATLPEEGAHTTDAMRQVLRHTSTEWHSLRHAC